MHIVSYDSVGFKSGNKMEKLNIFNNADIKNGERHSLQGFALCSVVQCIRMCDKLNRKAWEVNTSIFNTHSDIQTTTGWPPKTLTVRASEQAQRENKAEKTLLLFAWAIPQCISLMHCFFFLLPPLNSPVHIYRPLSLLSCLELDAVPVDEKKV